MILWLLSVNFHGRIPLFLSKYISHHPRLLFHPRFNFSLFFRHHSIFFTHTTTTSNRTLEATLPHRSGVSFSYFRPLSDLNHFAAQISILRSLARCILLSSITPFTRISRFVDFWIPSFHSLSCSSLDSNSLLLVSVPDVFFSVISYCGGFRIWILACVFVVKFVKTDLENWRPKDGRSATWVARCSRAMQRPLLCMTTPAPDLSIIRRGRLPMPATPSWRAGYNPPACSIWPLHWLPLVSTNASFPIFLCRYLSSLLDNNSVRFSFLNYLLLLRFLSLRILNANLLLPSLLTFPLLQLLSCWSCI